MRIEIEVDGDIIERQELLNGTETVTAEGAGGGWGLVTIVSWNRGLVEYSGEGDITLTRDDGAEIFGSLTLADVRDPADGVAADHVMRLEYEIDGGSGDFEAATGGISAHGELSGRTFHGRWLVDIA